MADRENFSKRKVIDEEFTAGSSGGGKRIRISDQLVLSSSPDGSAESVTKAATPEAIDLKVEKSETEVCMISNADFSCGESNHEEELKLGGGGDFAEMESPPPPSPLISTPERQSPISSDSSLPISGGGGGSSSSGGSVVVDGVMMPSAAEIEDFFSAAEKYQQERFAEKYNYDFVNGVPLEGRYKWIPLKL